MTNIDKVKALIKEAIELLNESESQSAFNAQGQLHAAEISLTAGEYEASRLRCA